MSQLAIRSALRFFSLRSKKLGLACGHCYLSLSRSSIFFLWAFFFGGFAVVVLFPINFHRNSRLKEIIIPSFEGIFFGAVVWVVVVFLGLKIFSISQQTRASARQFA